MKIISSPAKLMNIENSSAFLKSTQPHFIEQADLIQTTLKKKSPKYLMELMEISTKLADENWERNQNWKAKPSTKESAPALMTFCGEDLVLNLASKEYFKVIDKSKLEATIIDFDFYDYKEGKLKTIVVYTKHARGLVARYCALNDAKTLDDVKGFNLENYRIDEKLSTETNLVFTR